MVESDDTNTGSAADAMTEKHDAKIKLTNSHNVEASMVSAYTVRTSTVSVHSAGASLHSDAVSGAYEGSAGTVMRAHAVTNTIIGT